MKNGVGPSLVLLIAVLVCAGSSIYSARQLARAAPNEKTASAQVVSVEHHIFRYLRFNFYSCGYNFSVDGSFYVENEDCPQGIADDAAKGKYSDATEASMEANATVYYDPADPSVNSLLEFSAASQSYYRQAESLMGVGVLIIFFFVCGRLFTAAATRGKGGVVVDARGTVIYPEEISVGSEFAGPFSYEAVNAASSPGLRELYLEVVNQIHPDRAANEADLALRERLMKEANAAFERGDTETLRRVLEEYKGAIPAS